MRALHKKLLRDLVRLWPQGLAIALVMAAGVATFVLSLGSYRSLEATQATYYERYLFGHVFADVRRAPNHLGEEMRRIEGVAAVETRVKELALLDVPDLNEPASAMLVSLPPDADLSVNRLYLRTGRLPLPASDDEALISEQFAKAHGFGPGSEFAAAINGRKRTLTVVGTALGPEFIYTLAPGQLMPDPRRYAIVWMADDALSAAFDLEGAFSNVTLRLRRDASLQDVIDAVDRLLRPYGGTGAYGRKDQISHAFLDAELDQLAALSRMMPPVFLLVAAFLVNMTMTRLVALEREQIGLLKALGYTDRQIVFHYLQFVGAISLIGIAIGCAVGTWLGAGLTRLYGEFFYFPFLVFDHSADVYVAGTVVTLAAAMLGAARAVLGVAGLAPAVAMSPPAPPRYRRSAAFAWIRKLKPPATLTMVARQLWRFPFRTGSSVLGVSLAVAVLLSSFWTFGSVAFFIDVTFFQADRQDATINFTAEEDMGAFYDVTRLPGVLRGEPYRAIPIKLRHGPVMRRVSITAIPPDPHLSRVLDSQFNPVSPPQEGIALTDALATILRAAPGDTVEVELVERGGRTVALPVARIITGYLGLGAYMDLTAANRMLREADVITGVHVALDPAAEDDLFKALKETPAANFVVLKRVTLEKFYETLAQNLFISTIVYVALAVVIAFGVVYNYARISLSERARELASLRVLGFSRNEVSLILLSELAIITLLAQPVGWLLGTLIANAMIQSFESELYRMPLVLEPHIFAAASGIVVFAALISGLVVRRRIDRLDLIAVLKTRE
ncbi:MAG: ABC transporter permease [Pseudomonadota bacterium]